LHRSFKNTDSTDKKRIARIWNLEIGVWRLEIGDWRLEIENIKNKINKKVVICIEQSIY
jgi:hypothetical protein